MTWWKIVLLFLQYGPTIWKIVKEIIELIEEISGHFASTDAKIFRYVQRERMDDAVAYYRLTKDTEKLECIHGELSCQLENLKRR